MSEDRREKFSSMVRPGCIGGMFHFFDFHHFLFSGGCRTPATSTSPPATDLQNEKKIEKQESYHTGLEAPRNSLENEETEAAICEDYYGVPISIQISHPPAMLKKKKLEVLMEEDKKKTQAVTPRTRNIVARLMGIEGLHDEVLSPCLTYNESNPPFSISTPHNKIPNEKKNMTTKKKKSIQESKKESPSPRRPLRNLNSSGSISLPETPRVSSEKPRETDPRHSLQHNKENSYAYTMQELSFLREVMPKCRNIDEKSNLKMHQFSRENAKQKKISIEKIDRILEIYDGDDGIGLARKKKQIGKKYAKNNQPQKICSSPIDGFSKSVKSFHCEISPASINLIKGRFKPGTKTMKMEPGKCRKTNNYERFTEKVKRQPSQHTGFCQQTKFLQPAKKERGPLTTSHYNLEKEDPKLNYIKAILARADIIGEKSINWFSPSLPIDPTIFHILELWFPFLEPVSSTRLGSLKHRWNRKLLFHLVEEIIAGLLLNDPKKWRRKFDSKLLLSRIWSEIENFPVADCQIVGDIDALIAGDLPETKIRRILLHPAVLAEVQEIVWEIQRDMLDSLLGETAATLWHLQKFSGFA